jgi:tripartite-type tricarboxylate transporter receptor subunit TctC
MHHWRDVGAAALVILVSAGCAVAEPADFYTGKQISTIVPSGVGGGYDLYGRFLARFIGRHIPGKPAVVVKDMPAAGGIGEANHLYSIAAPDGLTMGVFQNTATLNQLGRMSGAKFDVRKFGGLGNMSIASTICALSARRRT